MNITYIKDRPTTGGILRRHRIEKKIEQAQLAQTFGVSPALISGIENDKKTLSKDMMLKYYEFFPSISLREKNEISFYEEYRLIGKRVEDHIKDLEKSDAAKDERIKELEVADKIVEIIKSTALKEYFGSDK